MDFCCLASADPVAICNVTVMVIADDDYWGIEIEREGPYWLTARRSNGLIILLNRALACGLLNLNKCAVKCHLQHPSPSHARHDIVY